MVAMSAVYSRVAAPPVAPHPYGLFSVAPPSSPGGTNWLAGEMWESWACTEVNVTTDPCINGTTPPAKTFDQFCAFQSDAKPFTVYVGVKKSGGSVDVADAQARSNLTDSEEMGVEEWLWAEMKANAGVLGTSTTPAAALAFVESALGRYYHGTGVIHMSRGTATLLAPQLVQKGTQLQTIAGTPVAAGGGYNQDQVDASPGPTQIFGTGALFLHRGPLDTVSAFNLAVNDELVLAERTYVAGWDCYLTGRTATI